MSIEDVHKDIEHGVDEVRDARSIEDEIVPEDNLMEFVKSSPYLLKMSKHLDERLGVHYHEKQKNKNDDN
jgi:hypothetical protein